MISVLFIMYWYIANIELKIHCLFIDRNNWIRNFGKIAIDWPQTGTKTCSPQIVTTTKSSKFLPDRLFSQTFSVLQYVSRWCVNFIDENCRTTYIPPSSIFLEARKRAHTRVSFISTFDLYLLSPEAESDRAQTYAVIFWYWYVVSIWPIFSGISSRILMTGRHSRVFYYIASLC